MLNHPPPRDEPAATSVTTVLKAASAVWEVHVRRELAEKALQIGPLSQNQFLSWIVETSDKLVLCIEWKAQTEKIRPPFISLGADDWMG
jgi:hypothetical protein